MKWHIFVILIGYLCFMVWFRKPAGRSFVSSDDNESENNMKDLSDFDRVNANAEAPTRLAFHEGYIAQISKNKEDADKHYRTVLKNIPNESNTLHNLSLLNDDDE